MNEKYENEILHKMYTESMQENAELKNTIKSLYKEIGKLKTYIKQLDKYIEEE